MRVFCLLTGSAESLGSLSEPVWHTAVSELEKLQIMSLLCSKPSLTPHLTAKVKILTWPLKSDVSDSHIVLPVRHLRNL